MFSLSAADLAGRVLGCGDGPAGFNAEATAAGHSIVSCDPIYAFTPAEIERRVRECYDTVISQVRHLHADFVWNFFRDPEDLGRARLAAMRNFLADFPHGQAAGRYVTASLPNLPFPDDAFDLALISHFLLLYSKHFDLEFHRLALAELLRTAREVRIFPLLTLERMRSPYVEPLMHECAARGLSAEIVTVDYEFQSDGNEMLRIRRKG